MKKKQVCTIKLKFCIILQILDYNFETSNFFILNVGLIKSQWVSLLFQLSSVCLWLKTPSVNPRECLKTATTNVFSKFIDSRTMIYNRHYGDCDPDSE